MRQILLSAARHKKEVKMKLKKFTTIALLLLSFVLIAAAASCKLPSGAKKTSDGSDDETTSSDVNTTADIHTVTVDGQIQLVLDGERASKPNEEKQGYKLIGYQTDDGTPYYFTETVTKDITIESIWEKEMEKEIYDVHLTVGDATSRWNAQYSVRGITFFIDVEDPYLNVNSADIGMNDNIELTLQTRSTIRYDQLFTVNFMCNANGDHWIRRATSPTALTAPASSAALATKGVNYDYEFTVTETGYKVNAFFSWEILNSSFEEGFGKVRFCPSMRNGLDKWDYYMQHSCVWGRPYTFILVDENGDMTRSGYTPTDVDAAFECSPVYEGKKLTENLALLDSNGAAETSRLSVGVNLFSDRRYELTPDALCESLIGKSFLYAPIAGSYAKVTRSGYVILIAPESASYADLRYNIRNLGFTKIASFDKAIAVSAVNGHLEECVGYYVKYCEEGESFIFDKYVITVFAETQFDEENVYPWLYTKAIVSSDFTGRELITRNWQGVTTVEMTKGGRIYASWISGGWNEPQKPNYEVIVYSDDKGNTWNDLYVIYSEEPDTGTGDSELWCDPDGRLWIFYAQHYSTKGWDGRSGAWAFVIDDPDAPVEQLKALAATMEPKRCFDGLLRTKPLVLSDGTWLAFPDDFADENNAIVYASEDKGLSWQVRGGAYLPIATDFDETVIVERLDGSLWMTVRNGSREIVGCYSYDKGYTWTEAEKTGIANPVSRFNMVRLPSGRLLLINNDSSSSRINMTAYLSEDDGATWPYKMLIDATNTTYPDYCIDENGTIYVLYDQYRTTVGNILMVAFDERYLMTHDVYEGKYYEVSLAVQAKGAAGEGENFVSATQTDIGWDFDADKSDSPELLQLGAGEQRATLKNFSAPDAYFQTQIKLYSVHNRNTYPKAGIRLVSGNKSATFYINAYNWFTGERYVGYVGGTATAQNWGTEVEVPAYMDYVKDYVTFGILKKANAFTLFVNGYAVAEAIGIGGLTATDEVSIQLFTIDARTSFKNYFATTDTAAYENVENHVETLFIGDSYFSYGYRPEFDEYFDGHNVAVGGTTVDYWIEHLNDYVLRYDPETIVVHLGVNDVDRGATGTQTYEKLKTLFTGIHSALPDTKIVFVSIDPSQNYWSRHTEVDAANELIAAYAVESGYIVFVNFAAKHYTEDGNYVKTTLEADGLHLNEKGLALLAQYINSALDEIKENKQ